MSDKEPHIRMWPDWADEFLQGELGTFLDFGCGPGVFVQRVRPRCRRAVGVDMDGERLAEARVAVPEASFIQLVPNTPVPLEDESFDTISFQEVIEHVPDERFVLLELTRLLKPGGRLLLTTPHRGLLTFLDPGNVKFVAPPVHRFIHRFLLRNKDYYEERFGADRRRDGMIADFALQERLWHRHYRLGQIRTYAPRALAVEQWAVYFPFMRAFWSARLVLKVLSRGRYTELPAALRRKQAELSRRRGCAGDQLVVLFRKVS